MATGGGVESHQKSEVANNLRELQRASGAALYAMSVEAHCVNAIEGRTMKLERGCLSEIDMPTGPLPAGYKIVHFIRHGEGYHNVAQREWRARPEWDGKSEPYTVDNDPPPHRYLDPELTPIGIQQAKDLQPRVANIMERSPVELLVVSPLVRATQTGLIAFEEHVGDSKSVKVLACELCHEMAGRHTCDKRLSKSELTDKFSLVDYSLIDSEEDPFWSETTREPWPDLAQRAGRFVDWLANRPEARIAVAAHSAILLSIFNAAIVYDSTDDGSLRDWFGTGEMRTVLIRFSEKSGYSCALQ